jgi:hypothetical protein
MARGSNGGIESACGERNQRPPAARRSQTNGSTNPTKKCIGEQMFITVEYKSQNGDTFTLAEGDGFLPIPNVGDQFSYKDGPFTVKTRTFDYYDDDNGELAVTVTLFV